MSGGLVVPLYLVILSFIGGAISLTRRVPEYQKQAASDYVGTDRAPALPPRMLREFLVFQIVQFISAPFIAVVAYYLIGPTTTSASVAIAFAAGFASESVLLLIRAAVNKVAPDTTEQALLGSVVGIVHSSADGKPVEAAQVKVVGTQGVVAKTNAHGLFVLNNVPAGECAVQAMQDKAPNTYALGSVVVKPAEATAMVLLTLAAQ